MDDQTKQMFWTAAFLAAFKLRSKSPDRIKILDFADKALEAFEERFGKET